MQGQAGPLDNAVHTQQVKALFVGVFGLILPETRKQAAEAAGFPGTQESVHGERVLGQCGMSLNSMGSKTVHLKRYEA